MDPPPAVAARPKSAGVMGRAHGNRLFLPTAAHNRTANAPFALKLATAPTARPAFSKPRPPSASAALSSATRRPRPPPASAANQTVHNGDADQPRSTADAISVRVMREEIETQRKVTRRAQREYNALRVQRAAKRQEIELLQRHLRAFDVEALPSPRKTAARPATLLERLKDEIRRLDAYRKTLVHMLDRLARRLQFLRANAEVLETQRVAAEREAAIFQDKLAQERSLCAELEFKRTQLADDRAAHAQHAAQLLASIRSEIRSRSVVSQQRHEADRRREEMLRLVESRPCEPSPVASVASVAPHPQASPDHHAVHPLGTGPPALQKRGSHGRRTSFHMLLDESLPFFGSSAASSVASPAALTVAMSSRRLQLLRTHTAMGGAAAAALVGETLATAIHRETFYQVYETQYERILEQTGESDLAIVLDRYRSYHETIGRLQQIEKDLLAEYDALDARQQVLRVHLQQLRLSGIAEVEKRKKIRDFLEQQHHAKSFLRAQAKEAFTAQLVTFAHVQQGILNITELLKCLDDKFAPPSLASVSASASASPSSSATGSMVHQSVTTAAASHEIDWLQLLLYSCQLVVRHTAGCPTEFSVDQIARLGEIDPTLGSAAGVYAAERLKHHVVGGDREWKPESDASSNAGRDEDDEDEEEDDDDDDDDDVLDEDVEDRETIKQNETDTVQQAELLFRTLDSRQQLARQEHAMLRLRRAFGLSSLEDSIAENAQHPVTVPPQPTVDQATKLAAVHAFFREKRQRDKYEQQQRCEALAALGGLAQSSAGGGKRGCRTPAPAALVAANGAAAMASIMAEIRAAPVGHRQSTKSKTPASTALSAFATGGRPQRKRSNAVSFALPFTAQAQQMQQHQQTIKQQESASGGSAAAFVQAQYPNSASTQLVRHRPAVPMQQPQQQQQPTKR